MKNIKTKIDRQLSSNYFVNYVITVSDVIRGVDHLKCGKSDDGEGLYFDHLSHGCHSLFVFLTLTLNAMFVHGSSPESMLLGTMIQIPKNKWQSLCN